jgi:hypothetical protein
MKIWPLSLSMATCFSIVFGAQTPTTGPSLAETKTWIETEGPAIMQSMEISSAGTLRSKADQVFLNTDKCELSWTTEVGWDGKPPTTVLHARIPLKDLDTGGFLVTSSTFLNSKPVFSLRIKTRASVGPTMTGWYQSKEQLVASLSQSVRNKEDGERLAAALRAAAILCGAPASPF